MGGRPDRLQHPRRTGWQAISVHPARNRAFEGDVVASLGLDGDDEDDERALEVPILEIYAPVRQTGTNKIIALAETSELAVDLMKEIRAAQYTSYAVANTA